MTLTEKKHPAKTYLGDSVYLENRGYEGIVLTTENGYGPSNTIYLEPAVVLELVKYLEKMVKGGTYE